MFGECDGLGHDGSLAGSTKKQREIATGFNPQMVAVALGDRSAKGSSRTANLSATFFLNSGSAFP
jgi:hypothetical protein